MKVRANGIDLNVEEQGSGDLALILLHYWGGSSRTWRHVTEPLSKTYRTVAVDQRGWGDSDAPSVGYALADHAADVAAVIEALDLRRYVLVGHSMGGKIAQLLASRRPRGLAGLVLVGSSLPPPLVLPDAMREMMLEAYSTRETVELSIDRVLTAKPLDLVDREQVIADSLRGALQAKTAWPISTSQEDIGEMVSSIEAPTLVIACELDRVDTVEATRTELLPRIAHAILRVVPETGHLSPLESPVELVQLIDEFVDRLT